MKERWNGGVIMQHLLHNLLIADLYYVLQHFNFEFKHLHSTIES